MFGAVGGLTCLLMPTFDRKGVFHALRSRHHYGTTGTRLHLDVSAKFSSPATLFRDDPALPGTEGTATDQAIMGDIVECEQREIALQVHVVGSAPIERLVVFNGTREVATLRPFAEDRLGRRIRVVWEGAEYRGRGRQTVWDGTATIKGNRYTKARAVNFLNPAKRLLLKDGVELAWQSVTTGNFAGFDMWLDDAKAGELAIATGPASFSLDIAKIGWLEHTFEAGGLGRRIRVFRLPDENGQTHLDATVNVPLDPDRDNPLYVRLTQEDGHQAWSSPIYCLPKRRQGSAKQSTTRVGRR